MERTTDSSFTKTIELYCDLWKVFHSKWTKIMVEIQLIWFWLANVICRYQIREKKKQYRQWTLLMVSAKEVTQFVVYTSQ